MTLLLAQTGAPTAVVNRSVRGFLSGAGQHEVLLGLGGPNALVNATFSRMRPSTRELSAAGSLLGGGRRRVTSEDLDTIVENLEQHEVTGLSLIGGNGTMSFLRAIDQRASDRGFPLRTVGIPKTIDNDLEGIDHSPGFASAARFLASSIPDMVRDHEAMRSVEQVRIVETMGRDTGWLALAASFHDHDPEFAPDMVLIPELPFALDTFLEDVASVLDRRGRAFLVVSEGVASHLSEAPVKEQNHARLIHGGISRMLAKEVSGHLDVTARGEVLGTAQRSSSYLASSVDQWEAEALGRGAAEWLSDVSLPTRVMATLGGESTLAPVPLDSVAGRVRHVPERWRQRDPHQLESFYRWLAPLINLG